MISPEKLKELKSRARRAFTIRDSNHRPVWRDAARFLSPSHGRFLDGQNSEPMKGMESRKHLVNDAAARARRICTSGFKGGLVPHTLEWFRVGLVDEEMTKWRPAKLWLQEVQRILYSTFSRSNFYSAITSPIDEQILFSTGALAVVKHPSRSLHFAPWTIGEYSIACNEFNEVDTSFRHIWRSIRQLEQEFGYERLCATSKVLFDNNNKDNFVKITAAIMPRRDYNPNKVDTLNMPIASVYWEEAAADNEGILGESGFRSMPAFFPRWETIGEDPWGVDSPGLLSLGDVKQIQVMDRQSMKQTELQGSPPMNIPSSMKGRFSMNPSAHNYVPDGSNEQIKATFDVRADIGGIDNKVARLEQKIERSFFNDLFLMLLNSDGGARTAFEIAKKHEEKLMILGSTLERQDSELLSPLLHRSLDELDAQGKLPVPPEEIQDTEIKYSFTGVLAQAQKAVNTNKVIEFFDFVTMAAQIDPDVVDKVDIDVAIDTFADNSGINQAIVVSTDEANKTRQARQQAQQGQAEMEQAAQSASIAKDAGAALNGMPGAGGEEMLKGLEQLIPAP